MHSTPVLIRHFPATSPRWKQALRVGAFAGAGVLALELAYLLVMNLAFATPWLLRAVNVEPQVFHVEYRHAWTFFPWRMHVSGLNLRFQDPNIQMGLRVEDASADLDLGALLRHKFRATHVRSSGASFRMLQKVDSVAGQEARVAAFPPIDGFERPPLRAKIPPPDLTREEIAKLWTIEFDDIDGTVREVWFEQYRYLGPGRATGSFELQPLTSVWVRPAAVRLDDGVISVGGEELASRFGLRIDVAVAPLDVTTTPGLELFRPMSGTVHVDTSISDLRAAQFYVPGLASTGNGTLTADLFLETGKLVGDSRVDAKLADVRVRYRDLGFDGNVNARVTLVNALPTGHAAFAGQVHVPVTPKEKVIAVLSGTNADFALSSNDLASPIGLRWLRGQVGELRVDHARAVAAEIERRVPFFPLGLGDGPLVGSCAFDLAPDNAVVTLHSATLGGAALTGAARLTDEHWNGAARGELGIFSLGLRVENDAIQVLPFVGPSWLGPELDALHIER